jgi:hypothetical protein
MKRITTFFTLIFCLSGFTVWAEPGNAVKPVFKDVPFSQNYSIKYKLKEDGPKLEKVFADRNGAIQILSSAGLLKTYAGAFLYPGTLVPDLAYRPMGDKKISNLGVLENQFIYLDDKAVLSNAWAGKFYSKHETPDAKIFAVSPDFTSLVSDGSTLKLVQDSKNTWSGKLTNDNILAIKYNSENGLFWILGTKSLSSYSAKDQKLKLVYEGVLFTDFDLTEAGKKAIIGTSNGFLEVNIQTGKQVGDVYRKIPVTDITCVTNINGKVWLGTSDGAFMIRGDGKYDYYNGERWIIGDAVKHIAAGPDHSVLILTDKGLGQICFKQMTLEEKALFYEKQVRQRHIRNGFNSSLEGMKDGDLSTGLLKDSDNDGLWTAMYLGGQIFRYAATKSDEALQNCYESLDALERLYSINSNAVGFPARSFERRGDINRLSDHDRWRHAEDPEWDWKATTSSDEAIGHIFALGAMAELINVEPMKSRAIHLIDILMQHIVDHNYYLIDWDGKPTTWGRWNPEYVNARPIMVGDRKICSSNIISMLQTAYHFTHKEIYKQKALELLYKNGYLENLMRPMKSIGEAPANADDLSKDLSNAWNHSDDEMYFIGYWGLYRYAFNADLKTQFKASIIDHWEIERPEKEAAWNIFTALASNEFDLKESVWWLQRYPLDMIHWSIQNSHRKDIEMVAPNFRQQTITEVLPPDERPVHRHNGNMFSLDNKGRRSNGNGEESAGDIWLLPYWMGRYLGVISAPVKK